MTANPWVVLATVAALIFYLATIFAVGAARGKHGVPAPLMSGPPQFERAMRVQSNTLEGLALFLPGLWLFALYWSPLIAAGLGAVWVLGRILYMVGYLKDPAKRGPGFGIQFLAALILVGGAAAGAILKLAAHST